MLRFIRTPFVFGSNSAIRRIQLPATRLKNDAFLQGFDLHTHQVKVILPRIQGSQPSGLALSIALLDSFRLMGSLWAQPHRMSDEIVLIQRTK